MCVSAIALGAHPDWRLVAIGNRDEFHERPAASLARWDDGSGIIAGRDLKSGGTWLGTSDAGRFVLVTNRRGFGDPDPDKASRGALVTDLLTGRMDAADGETIDLGRYNPFNLVVADARSARYLTNRPEDLSTGLAHGIYGLSNGALDEPWSKTLQLKGALQDWLNAGSADTEPLFAALASERLGDVGLHPRQASDVFIEPAETPPFIRNPVYGTRCSTVVAVDRVGQGRIIERRFDAQGDPSGESSQTFAWPA